MSDPVTGASTADLEQVNRAFESSVDCQLLTVDAKPINFSALYKNGKTNVLLFLRHFSCYICRDYITEVAKMQKKHEAELEANNINIVAIGCGEPQCIPTFKQDTAFEGDVYTDPTRKIYDNLGLQRAKNLLELFHGQRGHKNVTTNAFSGILYSFKQIINYGFGSGDKQQYGGEFIVGPDEKVQYAYLNQGALDMVEVDTLFQKLGINTE